MATTVRAATLRLAMATALAAGIVDAAAGAPSGNLVQPLGSGDLAPGRTDGVEHVFATGPFAMHALVRRDGRVDMLAFRTPRRACWRTYRTAHPAGPTLAGDGSVTFHLRTRGQVG